MTTRTFRAPILRRPVDVTGSSTVTTQQPTPTPFDDGYGPGFDGWGAVDANGVTLPAPTAPIDLATAVRISLSEQFPAFPPFDSDRGGYPTILYGIDADGNAIAEWPIALDDNGDPRVVRVIFGGQVIGRNVFVDTATMLATSGVIVAFGTNYDVTAVPVTTDSTFRVLAEIAERGQSAILELDGVEVRLNRDAGNLEYATIRTRYVSEIAIGTSVTDDLDRVWTVDSTNTIGDRRFLEFQCSRSIGGETPS